MKPNIHSIKNHFPVKHYYDTCSLVKIALLGTAQGYENKLPFQQRLNCLNFYFNGNGVDCLHAMLPRTGSHWSELVLSLAIDLSKGGSGDYSYERELYWPREGLNSRRLDWRVPTGMSEKNHHRTDGPAVGEHLFFHTRLPYFRVRSGQLKKMKIVVLVRSIMMSMAARWVKWGRNPADPTKMLENDSALDWDHFLNQSVEFFNSWGEVLKWHPNIKLYRYEDLVENPIELHKEILDFWGFDVPLECAAEACRLSTPDEMSKRIPENERISSRRIPITVENHKQLISPSRKKYIIDYLNNNLIYNLGYEYKYDTEYDFSDI